MTLRVPSPRTVGPVTRTDIVRFASAGGDFNPLHHDPEAARAAGFDDVIAMGQFQAGVLAGFLTDWVGVEQLRRLDVKFLAPVVLGDVIEVSATLGETAGGLASISLVAMVGERAVVSAVALVSAEVAVAVASPAPAPLPASAPLPATTTVLAPAQPAAAVPASARVSTTS